MGKHLKNFRKNMSKHFQRFGSNMGIHFGSWAARPSNLNLYQVPPPLPLLHVQTK